MEEPAPSLSEAQLDKFLGTVGAALKMTREHRKWSVYQLSRAAGLDERGIHRIERGETAPTLETLMRLTVALQVRLSSIIADAEKLAELDASEWEMPDHIDG